MSSYQRSLAICLKSLGLTFGQEVNLSGLVVDIHIPSLNLAIELDGPTHFTRNTAEPLGPTVFKHRIIKAMGLKLMSVTIDEWDDLIDMRAQRSFIEKNFKRLKVWAYHSHLARRYEALSCLWTAKCLVTRLTSCYLGFWVVRNVCTYKLMQQWFWRGIASCKWCDWAIANKDVALQPHVLKKNGSLLQSRMATFQVFWSIARRIANSTVQ